jgi:serine/threonine protein kinase
MTHDSTHDSAHDSAHDPPPSHAPPPSNAPPKRVVKKKKKKFGLTLTLDHSDAIKTPRPTTTISSAVDEGKSSNETSPTKKKKNKRNKLGLSLVVEDSNHEPESPKNNSPGLSINTNSPDQSTTNNHFGDDGGHGGRGGRGGGGAEFGMSDSGTFAIEGFLIRPDGIAFAPGDNHQSPGFGRGPSTGRRGSPLPRGSSKSGEDAEAKTNPKDNMVDMTTMTTTAEDELLRLCVLGKGAGGIVYKAVHVPSLRIVAIKKIAVFDQDKRHQMVRELKALYKNLVPIAGAGSSTARGSIREGPCPYIVAFHDAFITPSEGNISIVLEYMDGGSLQDIVDTGGCGLESVLANISYRFLLGIDFIHAHHQLHRDIKPSNLLINHHGAVKISDFGIVREMDGTQAKASTFVGTLTYMSPERISGEEYSYASDVWSFGLSLFTVALGRYPLQTEGGYWGLLHSLRDEPSPSLPEDEFSTVFRDFIDQCLKKDPKERPSASQLLEHPFLEGCTEQLEQSEQERKMSRQRDMMEDGRDEEDDMEDFGSDTARSELDEICELIMDLEYERWKKKEANGTASKSFPRVSRSKLAALADQLGLRLKAVERRFERKWLTLIGRLGGHSARRK